MTPEIREITAEDRDALHDFFAAVPVEDRTFFWDDVTDPAVVERWVSDPATIRRLAVDADGEILAFSALKPGLERTSHVVDARLIVSANARRQGLGRSLARAMLIEAIQQGFKKVTVTLAVDNTGAIDMFREIGFEPEALLRDHFCDPDGTMHDLLVLAHPVDDNWTSMLTVGMDEAMA
jgi:ribosomal protein S18 acetylase RimI-like enzyme